MKILHVIKNLGLGGASRSLCAIGRGLRELGDYQIAVASLKPAGEGKRLLRGGEIELSETPSPSKLQDAVRQADIVQVEWWNSPQLNAFLNSKLPPARVVSWIHVAGDQWPHLVSRELIEFSDFVIAGCGYAARNTVLADSDPQKNAVIFSTADFSRLERLEPKPHSGFRVGYVGSAKFTKMHPDFVAMSAACRIPEARFVVCGSGDLDLLLRQTQELRARNRFEFLGYVEDLRPVLETLDVYGYPLCDSPGAELNVQEAMFAGVPPVVFGLGGLQDVVTHQETGLVVDSPADYTRAIEFLWRNPAERARLGRNARAFAQKHFGGLNSARKVHQVYQKLIAQPKRERRWNQNYPVSSTLTPGALRFVESVHSQAPFFAQAAGSHSRREISAAESRIAQLTPRQKSILKAYHDDYPEDSFLKKWYGLATSPGKSQDSSVLSL